MIDTHGLPIKFTFYVSGKKKLYLIDFTDTDPKSGNPYLIGLEDGEGNYGWRPDEIAKHIDRGGWIIAEVIEKANTINVEDLL